MLAYFLSKPALPGQGGRERHHRRSVRSGFRSNQSSSACLRGSIAQYLMPCFAFFVYLFFLCINAYCLYLVKLSSDALLAMKQNYS